MLCEVLIYVRCAGEALEYEPFHRGYLNQPMHIIKQQGGTENVRDEQRKFYQVQLTLGC
jgi:hypothetical protein